MVTSGVDARALLRSPLAVLLVLLAVAGGVLALSGSAREALRASTTREDPGYVALALTDVDALRACGNRVVLTVGFSLDNELGEDASVDYVVSVVSRRDERPPRVTTSLPGSVEVADGAQVSVSRPVATPRRGDYVVEVRLVGDLVTRDQSVSVSCAEQS